MGGAVVALPGVGQMPAPCEDEQDAAWVFYVAATRSKQRLEIGVGGMQLTIASAPSESERM